MNDDAWISKKEIVMKSIQMNGDDYDEYDDNEKHIRRVDNSKPALCLSLLPLRMMIIKNESSERE